MKQAKDIVLSCGLLQKNKTDTLLLIQMPTRISYQFQVGGGACDQVIEEGFVINLGDFAGESEFDQCSYGCHTITHSQELKNKLADAFEEFLKENCHRVGFDISVDYNRLDEICEAWIPVLVSGVLADKAVQWKGYLYVENCD